jgi:hypothetical protein
VGVLVGAIPTDKGGGGVAVEQWLTDGLIEMGATSAGGDVGVDGVGRFLKHFYQSVVTALIERQSIISTCGNAAKAINNCIGFLFSLFMEYSRQ